MIAHGRLSPRLQVRGPQGAIQLSFICGKRSRSSSASCRRLSFVGPTFQAHQCFYSKKSVSLLFGACLLSCCLIASSHQREFTAQWRCIVTVQQLGRRLRCPSQAPKVSVYPLSVRGTKEDQYHTARVHRSPDFLREATRQVTVSQPCERQSAKTLGRG